MEVSKQKLHFSGGDLHEAFAKDLIIYYLVTVSSLFLTIIVASGFLGSDPGWISSMVKLTGWKNCPKNRNQNHHFRHVAHIPHVPALFSMASQGFQ